MVGHVGYYVSTTPAMSMQYYSIDLQALKVII